MIKTFEATTSSRALEPRLARRRRIETQQRSGWKGRARSGYRLWHDRLMAAVLKSTLQITGLYERGVANALRPVVRHLRLRFVELPPALDGFRILHLSDLHIDAMDGLAEILAEQILDLPVDLCVLTGDYRFEISGRCHAVYPRMRRILGSIRSRHGVVGILGNHDCADIAVELENVGVRMLINEAVAVGSPDSRLWVIGVDDPHYYGCDDLIGALDGAPDESFKLLLAHTPEIFEEAAQAGIDLYLTGHTHAGQICLPWLGPVVLHARCPRPYAHGHWHHASMQGYTTSGVGCSLLPVRFHCPAEIAVIELARTTR
jgi:predicted MPP superfamily phosphohydrolase